MRKKIPCISLFMLFLTPFIQSQGIREPICAGTFYTKESEALSHQIDSFLQKSKKRASLSEEILALIVPHAGYIYSGQVAASAYRVVKGKDYETVIIIAPSHRYGFGGCSIYLQGGYRTPLGVAKIDEPLASAISKASGFKYVSRAHQEEHSVEVQIPFIQKTLPQAKIVPIVMGFPTKKTVTTLAYALAKVLPGKKALIIVSTDMSHYLSKKRANDIDAKTASLIQSFKTNTLIKKIERGEGIMCGGGGVVSALLYSKKQGEAKVEVLHYADSQPFGSPESKVVGYLAAAVYSENQGAKLALSPEEKKELLQIARSAIKHFVLENQILNYETQNSNFLTKKGAFVTLKKRGSLRGCIGFIEPVLPLYQTVIQAAIYAACKDRRFPSIAPEELDHLEIEISVLSPLKKIVNPQQIKVGKHGLVISRGDKKGLLLPQVPVENHWSREIFLQQACLKAGLSRDAWKSGADIFTFEAIVFR